MDTNIWIFIIFLDVPYKILFFIKNEKKHD